MKIWNTLVCLWIGVIRGAEQGNDEMLLMSSPLTASDGEIFTLICNFSSANMVNLAWLQNNATKVISQRGTNCSKQSTMGNNISRFNVSCGDTVHSIQFTFNSTRDQGEWQCGNLVNDIDVYPRSNVYNVGAAGPVMPTESSLTPTLYTETRSEPGAETPPKVIGDTRDSDDSGTIYIVVGTVCGAVLFAVDGVVIVCVRRRRQAVDQKEDMKRTKAEASPDYQNTTSCHTVENDLYRSSCDITPVNEAEHEKDDFIMSDAYVSVDIPATSTCTPREQGASYDVDVDSVYAKPDKSRSLNVAQVSDLYAEVMKPKKKRQDDPNMSEDVNTGDVYANPNKR